MFTQRDLTLVFDVFCCAVRVSEPEISKLYSNPSNETRKSVEISIKNIVALVDRSNAVFFSYENFVIGLLCSNVI